MLAGSFRSFKNLSNGGVLYWESPRDLIRVFMIRLQHPGSSKSWHNFNPARDEFTSRNPKFLTRRITTIDPPKPSPRPTPSN